jgi:hypothetical protein
MLDKTRHTKRKANPVYALATYSIELKKDGWYFYPTPFFSDPAATGKGPYSSIGSAALMIARALAKEAVARHQKKR